MSQKLLQRLFTILLVAGFLLAPLQSMPVAAGSPDLTTTTAAAPPPPALPGGDGPAPAAPAARKAPYRAPQAEAPPDPALDYLVTLAPSDDPVDARYQVQAELDWLKHVGQIAGYKWLPAANAFKVIAGQRLDGLAQFDEVADLSVFTEAALAALPVAPEITAPTVSTGTIQIQNTADDSFYMQSMTDTETTVSLYDSFGVLLNDPDRTMVAWSWNGTYYYDTVELRDSSDRDVYMSPGDVLTLEQVSEDTYSVVIPDLFVEVDRAADTAKYMLPEDITNAGPSWFWSQIQGINHDTDPASWDTESKNLYGDAGEYTTYFTYTVPTTNTLDLIGGQQVYAQYGDTDGNWFQLISRVPRVQVRVYDDYVNGYMEPRTAYTVTLEDSGGVVKGTAFGETNADGYYFAYTDDPYGSNVNAMPGDVVTVESARGTAISVDVVTLTADVDPTANTVTGVGPPDLVYTQTLDLPNLFVDLGTNQRVPTNASGEFLADDLGDFYPNDQGELEYFEADYDRVYRYIWAPVVYVRGEMNDHRGNNRVYGQVPERDTLVTVELQRGGGTIAADIDQSDSSGNFRVDFEDLYSYDIDILGGDTVVVSSDGFSTSVAVPTIDILSDWETDTIHGTTDATVVTDTWASPPLTLTLAVFPDEDDYTAYGKQVLPDAGGVFSATNPFYYNANPADSSSTRDWDEGQEGSARYVDDYGHIIWVNYYAPESVDQTQVFVRGYKYKYENYGRYEADNYVGFIADSSDCEDGTATLKDSGGAVKALVTGLYGCTTGNGVSFEDVYGNPIDIEAGDSVEVTFGDKTTVVDVPNFDVLSDSVLDEIHGTTNAVVMTDTWASPAMTQTLAVWPHHMYDYDYGKHVLPEASGVFSATNPFHYYANPANGDSTRDWNALQSGHLRYVDADGNYVYDDFTPPPDYQTLVLRLRGRNGYEHDSYVWVYNPGCGDTTELVLKDSSGEIKSELSTSLCNSTWSGYFSEDIEAGDIVEASSGEETTTVVVPSFDMVSDAETNTMSGNTNAVVITDTAYLTETLALWPKNLNNWGWGKPVMPDASGDFLAENPFYEYADLDSYPTPEWRYIDPGDHGHLLYIDADENQVYDIFWAPYLEPEFAIHKDSNGLEGVVTEGDTLVTVSLERAGSVIATAQVMSSPTGEFYASLFGPMGELGLITEGDTLLVEWGGQSESVDIPRLTGMADAAADTVSGEGPADSWLRVWHQGSGQTVLSDASGAYNADYSGINDIEPGEYNDVAYLNPDGHTIWIDFYAGPQIEVTLTGPNVEGYGLYGNMPLTVTLERGGSVLASTVVETNYNNWFEAHMRNDVGQVVPVEAGDLITTDFGGGMSASMTAADLTAVVDADTDMVTGTGPADDSLWVRVDGGPSFVVPTDSSGDWSLDPEYNLMPGDPVLVQHTNSNYHSTYLRAWAPVVYVRGYGPDWNAYSYSMNQMSGYLPARGFIEISLQRDGITLATATETGGWFDVYFYDLFGLSVDIMGGDQISIGDQTFTVPEIDAVVDAEGNSVSGTGPADDALGLYVNGYEETLATDATGAFSTTVGGIDPGDWAYLRHFDGELVWTHAWFRNMDVGYTWLNARWYSEGGIMVVAPSNSYYCANCVSGQVAVREALTTVSLQRDGSELATASTFSNYNGWFNIEFSDAMGDPLMLEIGDVIEAMTDGAVISMTVADLTAQANAESDVIFGTGPAEEYVYGNWFMGTWVRPDGTYFAEVGDIDPRDHGLVWYNDEAGNNTTYVQWAVPYIAVQEYGNSVWGYVAPNEPTTVQLLSAGGAERGSVTLSSNSSSGYFGVDLTGLAGEPLVILPDETVVVSTAGAETIVPVTPLSAEVDMAADLVSGIGPAGEILYVSASGSEKYPTVDATGNYVADFSDRADLQGGDYVYLEYLNPDENLIWMETHAPQVRVNSENEIVDGYFTPYAIADLVLMRAGSMVAETTTVVTPWGFFSAFFTDASDALVDIMPGDTVNVSAGVLDVSMVVEELMVSVDPDTGVVSGTGPASTPLYLRTNTWDVGTNWDDDHRTVYTDASGAFSVDLSGELIMNDYTYAYVAYYNADNNQSAYHSTPAQGVQQEKAEDRLISPQLSTFGAANGEDLTPPLVYEHASAGSAVVFVSEGGTMVITDPSGSVVVAGNFIRITDAQTGAWQVQVFVNGGSEDLGRQYGIAVGTEAYIVFLPIIFGPLAP